MLQLCYISTARPGVDRAAIEAILAASRRNNAAAHVSGVLLYNGKRFLQLLEGPEAAVRATFARIGADPRHFALVKLSEHAVDACEFGAWDMAYESLLLDRAGVRDRIEQLTRGASANLRSLFTSYAAI